MSKETRMTYAFVVGCPRSGTTWLQMLLSQHPEIATTQETHLFNSYIAPLQDAWKAHASTPRHIGLQAAMTSEEFDSLCSDFARRALSRIAVRGSASSVVLEKTPGHVRDVPLIVRLLPEARFIHLIRDPRAVVASLCAAGRSWGHTWASSDPVVNARLWVSDVSAGRDIPSVTEHHHTIRYEDLLGDDGWRVLQDSLKWLGLDADDGFCRQALKNCTIERLRHDSKALKAGAVIDGDPTGFYRKGRVDSWCSELARRDLQIIEYIAGELMQEYGYIGTTEFADGARKPFRLQARELLDSVEWRSGRAIARIFERGRRLM
jgi:hypothetical protein